MAVAAQGHPYDRYAEAYREWWGPILAPSAVRLLDRVDGLFRGDRPVDLIDVGTGTGSLLLAALDRWPKARGAGIDPSLRMMEVAEAAAEERGPALRNRVRFLEGRAGDLPIPDASVDLVLSSFAIQLAPSRAAAVREAVRVLRPGGHFACITWQVGGDPFEPDNVVDMVLDELEVMPPPIGPEPHVYGSPATAAAELRRVGFRHVKAATEWLVHRFTAESYVGVLEHWIEDDLFASLSSRRRDRLRARLLTELRLLPDEELVWRRPLVSVVGEAPRP
jgi:ubiquinone/menaquinone biosynthesis C-methylase UbiE